MLLLLLLLLLWRRRLLLLRLQLLLRLAPGCRGPAAATTTICTVPDSRRRSQAVPAKTAGCRKCVQSETQSSPHAAEAACTAIARAKRLVHVEERHVGAEHRIVRCARYTRVILRLRRRLLLPLRWLLLITHAIRLRFEGARPHNTSGDRQKDQTEGSDRGSRQKDQTEGSDRRIRRKDQTEGSDRRIDETIDRTIDEGVDRSEQQAKHPGRHETQQHGMATVAAATVVGSVKARRSREHAQLHSNHIAIG